MTVFALDLMRSTNARLIADLHKLGYLKDADEVVDVTYGQGAFWREWRPRNLFAHDLDPRLAPDGPQDFTALRYSDAAVDVVVFDPPYKLNGTPGHASDERYGVGGDEYVPVADRITLILDGCTEAARVAKRIVIVKCMDQVVSGRVRWLCDEVTEHMADHGWVKVDRLEVIGHREQPEGRRQLHARRNSSSCLVFGRRTRTRNLPEPDWQQLTIDEVLAMEGMT